MPCCFTSQCDTAVFKSLGGLWELHYCPVLGLKPGHGQSSAKKCFIWLLSTSGGNTLQSLHYWVALNLTEIHHDPVRVFGNPVLAALLSLCLHSGTLGPPQQSQVRWAQHLYHHMLTLVPQSQHVRTRNSFLGGTVFIQNIPRMRKKKLRDAIKNPLHISGQFEHHAFNHLSEAGDGEAKGRACPCRHSALWWIWNTGLFDWSL